MKFMVTFTGKPAHFKEATSKFLKTGARSTRRSEDVGSMAWSIHRVGSCRDR
jgi:hypothetical protein